MLSIRMAQILTAQYQAVSSKMLKNRTAPDWP
jgi:hypothetical protein